MDSAAATSPGSEVYLSPFELGSEGVGARLVLIVAVDALPLAQEFLFGHL